MTVLALWTAFIATVVLMMILLTLAATAIVSLILDPESKLTFDEAFVPVLCLLAGRAERQRLHQILEDRPQAEESIS